MEFSHVSVLLDETIEALRIKPDGIYVDGTLGGAGHSSEICKRLSPKGRLIGIDRDEDAIAAATEKLSAYSEQVTIVKDTYEHMPEILTRLQVGPVDGILLDLGVSSHQLDTPERGFSYLTDAPLDMRMDREDSVSAYHIVNEYSQSELAHIIREYGEDRFANNIAKHIVEARKKQPIETTGQLSDLCRAAIPMKVQKTGGHPAKRTFQAIRIECNRELEQLENTLDGMIDCLKPGGVLAVITFHSLEDRIVKNNFKRNENPCTCPPDFPVCVCGKESKGKALRKPILPTEKECEENSRSKSAKLRTFTKK